MGAVGGAAFGLAAAAAEITELPKGPDRDLVSRVCQSCHDLHMAFDAAGRLGHVARGNDRKWHEYFGG